uniref:Glyco_trans_4-like_N domain-containing protein n=1 Tax=Schistosoma mansoni TaxID=6183 RepID=A0A5K4F7G0_SCHMA
MITTFKCGGIPFLYHFLLCLPIYMYVSNHIHRKNRKEVFNNAIARHLKEDGHDIKVLESFKVMNKQKNSKLLGFA